MTDLTNSPFGQFIVVLLLGLAPAYVLGRFLPSNAMVKGPFRGLTISFTGSFALYLFILLLGASFITSAFALSPRYADIVIDVRMNLEGANQRDLVRHQAKAILHPARGDVSEPTGNGFNIQVTTAAKRTANEGFVLSPTALILQYPGYVSRSIPLQSAMVTPTGRVWLGDVTLARQTVLDASAASADDGG